MNSHVTCLTKLARLNKALQKEKLFKFQKSNTSVLPIKDVQTARLGNSWYDFKVGEDKDAPKNGFRFWADFSPVQPSVVVYMSGVKGEDKGVPSFISPTTYPTNIKIDFIPIEQVRVFFGGEKVKAGTMMTMPTAYPLIIDLTKEKVQTWHLGKDNKWTKITAK
ncbi:hypothetical protein H0H92_013689 [Tricholoma furcatifolium]|nr:hypothetical protein H0H92_013689 [Tricholoma furcatifolium]